MSDKVLIIGLDGATWEVLDPLIKQGKMPNLASLKEKGGSGLLISTVPPITAPAWSTFQTGVNPGKHGIFDFSVFDLEKEKVDLVDSTFLKKETIWAKAARAGKKVITINVPLTYPPQEVPGWIQVGGPLSGTVSPRFVYPEEIYQEVVRFDYEVPSSGLEVREKYSLKEAVDLFIQTEKKRYALTKHFIKSREWDLLITLNSAMDAVQHSFYPYLEKGSNPFKKEKEEVARFYQFCDKEIGELVQLAGKEAEVFIVSDHGFKKVERVINLNILLARKGYLALSPRYFLKRGIELARRLDLLNLEERVVEGLVFRNKQLRKKLFSFGSSFINWDKTKAYMGPGSIYGNVYLRDKALKQEIKAMLEQLRDPATDQKVIQTVWTREEIYEGGCVERMPDLVLEPSGTYAFKTNLLLRESKLFREVDPGKEQTGTHAREGVVVWVGPRAGAESKIKADIGDIAPTVLSILNLETSQDMDGQSLA